MALADINSFREKLQDLVATFEKDKTVSSPEGVPDDDRIAQ